jgi:serine/threonine-protein kinase
MLQVLDVDIGERIGNYRVEQVLGPTGCGVLLQAQHLVLPRRVILKVVHDAFAHAQAYVLQTLREACILEAIAHPGVPVVYESGLLKDRRPWFAFEAIHGPTLEELLAAGAMAPRDAAGLLRDLADVLEHAHGRGVIHRGLRPERVVVTPSRRFSLCIPDWSEAIAHDATAHVPQLVTEGSGVYLAPELAEDGEVIDDRADMFALGVIGYRALTGALPFAATSTPHLPTQQRRPDVPRELAQLIDSLLAFERFDRPSASEVRSAAEGLFDSLPQHVAARRDVHGSGPAVTLPPIPKPPSARRRRWTPEVRRSADYNVGQPETTLVDLPIASDDDLANH